MNDYTAAAIAWLKVNRPAVFSSPMPDADKVAFAESAGWKSEVKL